MKLSIKSKFQRDAKKQKGEICSLYESNSN